MKKIEFNMKMDYVGCKETEIVEFEDNATEKEIESDFIDWVWDRLDGWWKEVK